MLANASRLASSGSSTSEEYHANTAVAFYITAHADDWELFRGQQAFADIQSDPSNKIVFIHTAGDAGSIDGWWEAREQGAIAAVRAALPAQPLTIHVDYFNGHPVPRYTCANTATYFMRLPDGNPDGTGYPSTDHQSLSQLRDANMPIVAVDGSATYTTWNDFCDTLSAMVQAERQGVPQEHSWINAADYRALHQSRRPRRPQGDGGCRAVVRRCARLQSRVVPHVLHFMVPRQSGWHRTAEQETDFDAYGLEVLRVTTIDGSPVQPQESEWTYWGEYNYVRLLDWDQPDTDDPCSRRRISARGSFTPLSTGTASPRGEF